LRRERAKTNGTALKAVPFASEHDPEKWMPVFRKDHAPLRI
jgi:hypothetical protein